MSDLQKLLWNELRLICCTTGLNAKRIVMVTEEDIKKLAARIEGKVEAK
jgi:hypothetical protein